MIAIEFINGVNLLNLMPQRSLFVPPKNKEHFDGKHMLLDVSKKKKV